MMNNRTYIQQYIEFHAKAVQRYANALCVCLTECASLPEAVSTATNDCQVPPDIVGHFLGNLYDGLAIEQAQRKSDGLDPDDNLTEIGSALANDIDFWETLAHAVPTRFYSSLGWVSKVKFSFSNTVAESILAIPFRYHGVSPFNYPAIWNLLDTKLLTEALSEYPSEQAAQAVFETYKRLNRS